MDAMEQGELDGMQTFDGEIEKMIRAGTITKDDGIAYASNYGNLLLRLGDMGDSGGAPAKAEPEVGSMLDMIE
jgi:Tfp pilus assembly ATPase PilU